MTAGGGSSSPAWQLALRNPGPLGAVLLIAALLGLLGAGAWATFSPEAQPPKPRPVSVNGKKAPSDADFYRAVIDRIHAGESYYPAVTDAQRRGRYPLHPFITVRTPVLAVSMAALPDEMVRRGVLALLAVATVAAWTWRFVGMGARRFRLALAFGLLCAGVVAAFSGAAYPFHEVWAGLLVAFSMAQRRPNKWALAVLVGLIAALLRELSAPYLLAMAALAWRDGQRKEALAWMAAVGVFALALVAHANAVAPFVRSTDLPSQGWLKISGWRFALNSARWNTAICYAPFWVSAVLTPFALFGLAMWRGPAGERVALTVFGYTAAFVFLGRPENAYWGLMIAPLLPLGLFFAPPALLALVRSAAAWRGREAAFP